MRAKIKRHPHPDSNQDVILTGLKEYHLLTSFAGQEFNSIMLVIR